MSFTDGIDVSVGDPILASHVDNLADNTEFNREYADVQHNFDISTADGTHKAITAPSLTLPTTGWLGLGAAAGRLTFTDAATDVAAFSDCNVTMGGTLGVTGATTLTGAVGVGTSTLGSGNKVTIYNNVSGAGASTNNALVLQYDATTLYGQHYMDSSGLYHIHADALGVAGGNLALGGDTSVQLWTGSTPAVKATLDSSGNLGLGVTPKAWASTFTSLQLGSTGAFMANAGASAAGHQVQMLQNAQYDTDSSFEYIVTDEASMYQQTGGTHVFNVAGSGTAGNDISWTTALTINNDKSATFGSDISVPATSKVYLDGGSNAYIDEVAADHVQIFAGSQGVYFTGSQFNTGYAANSSAEMSINYSGYAGGATQFRNVQIYDGKNAAVALFDGSTKATTLYGDVTIDAAGVGNLHIDGATDSYLYFDEGGTYKYRLFNSAAGNVFGFQSTDIDGGGTDGNVFTVADGTDDVKFYGGIGVGGSAAPTTGIAVTGASTFSAAVTAGGILSIDDTTDTSSTTTGSIHTDGGVGIAKALWVGTTSRLVGAVTMDAGLTAGSNITSSRSSTGVSGSMPIIHVANTDGTNTGDVGFKLSVAAMPWWVWIDNSDSDKLKIDYNTEPGLGTCVEFDTSAGSKFWGTVNINTLTASQDVQTDASKNLTSVSDATWKNDLGTIDAARGIEIVRGLRPHYYDWVRDSKGNTVGRNPEMFTGQPRIAGFFSQEVYAIFPEGSPGGPNTDEDGADHWGLNMRGIVAAVTAGVQDVDTRVMTIERQIVELQDELAALRKAA